MIRCGPDRVAPRSRDIEALDLDGLKRLVLQLLEEVASLKLENAALGEEIARLKGLEGRPKLAPSGMEEARAPGRGLNGTHHGVSHQQLQAYLNECTFRFNRRFYPFNAFRSLLGIAGDISAPTYAELYSGEWAHPRCCGCG